MEIEICGKFKVLVDAEDLEKISGFKWNIANCSRHNVPKLYARVTWHKGRSRTYYMHRVIMGEPLGMVVDHKNGNGLDNRRCNLEITTIKENARRQKEQAGITQRNREKNGRFTQGSSGNSAEAEA